MGIKLGLVPVRLMMMSLTQDVVQIKEMIDVDLAAVNENVGVDTAGPSVTNMQLAQNVDIMQQAGPRYEDGTNGERETQLSTVATMTNHGSVERISLPSGVKEIRKFVLKDFKVPATSTNPPYYVEYPPEEGDDMRQANACIPKCLRKL